MRHPAARSRVLTSAAWLLAACVLGVRPGAASRAHAPAVEMASARDVRALVARPGARATLVNVWATWCAPCRQEFPVLLRIARAHAREGVRLVLVSADFKNQMSAIRRFLATQGVSDSTYLKAGGDMEFINGLNSKWSGALPATFIYDADGQLATFWEGIADSARFEHALNEVLHAAPPRKDSTP